MPQFGLRVGSYKRIGLNFFSFKKQNKKKKKQENEAYFAKSASPHFCYCANFIKSEYFFLLKQEIMYVIVHNFYMRLLLLSKKDSQKEGVIAC